jgi:hypothetical protein
MAGKVDNCWLGSLQLTPCLTTCHTPSIVGVASRGGLSALYTSEVLAARARVITAICVLSFIFVPLVDLVFFFLFWPSLTPPTRNHFWPFIPSSPDWGEKVSGFFAPGPSSDGPATASRNGYKNLLLFRLKKEMSRLRST